MARVDADGVGIEYEITGQGQPVTGRNTGLRTSPATTHGSYLRRTC